jgi:hypothetical protein
MKSTIYTAILLLAALALSANALGEIVYTQVNVTLPVNNSYGIDLDRDGTTDFVLRSSLLEAWCINGDEYSWTLEILPGGTNQVVTSASRAGSSYAAALPAGVAVGDAQAYAGVYGVMANLYWGGCGSGSNGQWLNAPDRFLGLRFQAADGSIHFGWAKVTTVAYVDQLGYLHSATLISGFAYETIADRAILTGQVSE